MEHYIINDDLSDITYLSELTPTPIACLALAILQLVWGLNSCIQFTFAFAP